MKTSYITALFLAISLPVFAGETSATFVQDQDHAFDQPTNLTLSNFFTDGWDQAWTQRDTPDGAPDLALFHGDTAFLERDLRMDYSSEEYTPGDRSIRTLDGSSPTPSTAVSCSRPSPTMYGKNTTAAVPNPAATAHSRHASSWSMSRRRVCL